MPLAPRPTIEPAVPARRLRILCLHGYHGSAAVLRSQMAGLVAGLDSIAEFVYVDAPSLAEGDHGWWHAVSETPEIGSDDPGVSGPRRRYQGWSRTLATLAALFEASGPFDGIFGFSQGAALAGLLPGLRAPGGSATAGRPLSFAFAILVGGFPSNDPDLAELYTHRDGYELPSFHLLGRSDSIVSPEASRALAGRFQDPLLVEHGGGHVVASDPDIQRRLRAFLEQRFQERDAAPAHVARSSTPEPIDLPLWAGRPSPAAHVFFPQRAGEARSPALVVLRGGAYATSQGSGGGAAAWAAGHGMVGVEVPYRCQSTGDAYPSGYSDAARAVRLVRDHADAWGIDPRRVGVLGFSAGGHLASLLSTQPALYLDPEDDLISRFDARPDFAILAYPLISFVEGYAPGAFLRSAENFFARRDLDEPLRRRFSSELHVTPDHPAVFLWTTADDALVPASHAAHFTDACKRAGVPVTFRLFPRGPHGLGLALDHPGDIGTWTVQALDWLRARQILDQGRSP